MRVNLKLPNISEDEKTPAVVQLLELIEQQVSIVQQQAEQIQLLKDEIARLKGHNPKPDIKPSSLGKKEKDKSKKENSKRAGSKKKKKTAQLQIHDTIPIPLENIPEGAKFKGYNPFVVQGLRIKLHNTRYLLATYETADGKYICSKLPEH